MADLKISALPASTTPLAGSEVLPIVQSSTTKQVSVANLTAGRAVSTAALTTTGKLKTTYAGGGDFVAEFQNTTSATPYGVFIKDAATPAAGYPLIVVSDSTGATTHFRVDSSTGNTGCGGTPSGSASIRLKVSGSAEVAAGNLVISTAGNGIDFSATSGSGTSELLSDYEEGTFTPTVSGSTSAGAATYITRTAWYTKVGRQVTFTIYVGWSAHTGTGNIVLSGLPFTSNASAPIAASTAMAYNFAMPALTTMVAWVEANASNVSILTTPVGGGAWNLLALDPVVDVMFVSGSYFV